MTNKEAIAVLRITRPIPHRGDGKSTTHALEMIALDMAIKALEREPEWIPVSERLPENESRVLVTIQTPMRSKVRSGMFDNERFYNDNGDTWKATDKEVIAWMPLPKPYKAESEEA